MSSYWTVSSLTDDYPVDLRLDNLIVGETRVMQRLKQAVMAIAPSDAPVLIHGPTGAGKELVAQALHMMSGRTGPLVAVNCGAIPEDLLESELFGHEKGAFTGAQSRRIGLIEQASGGTLFLDEIGDMPAQVQVKLLRALETRRIQRVGGGAQIEVDFRLVSATHRNLHDEMTAGRFREDLLFRIDVFALSVPALRDRVADIPLILRVMALNSAGGAGQPLRLAPEALALMTRHSWPGNVRELRNFHDRAQVLFRGRTITEDDLRSGLIPSLSGRQQPAAPEGGADLPAEVPDLKQMLASQGSMDLRGVLQRVEEKLILSALDLSGGCVSQAADLLRLKRTTLIGKMQKLGIGRGLNI